MAQFRMDCLFAQKSSRRGYRRNKSASIARAGGRSIGGSEGEHVRMISPIGREGKPLDLAFERSAT